VPIYEYRCRSCGKTTEKLQGISEPPLADCPECGGRVDRLISAGAFVLKGSGWYATDYAGKGNGRGSAGNGARREAEGAGKPACPASGGEAKASCAGCPKTAD